MKRLKKKGVFCLTVFAIFTVLLAFAMPASAAVTVYAEGAYTGSDLVVYIYADIDTDSICSAGVKLTYNNSVLTVASSEKNEAVWYMGDGTTNQPYMNPENAGDGVIVICGKIDTNSPSEGVIGNRVLLGKVTFNRIDGGATPVADPENYFGTSIDLGRVSPFANFVTTGGTELDDDVDFATVGVIVRERGDANADGSINAVDYIAIRNNLNSSDFPPYMDCNADGNVNAVDYVCVRNKL